MIVYEIKKNDFQFVINNIKNKYLINLLYNSIDLKHISPEVIILKMNREDVKKILEELGNLFILKGLKDNDEPNELGNYIEKLIDLFNRKLYEK